MKLNTPFKIIERGGYCDVVDANDDLVLGCLTDIELGWTDTTTGNYVDPEKEHRILQEIVLRINAFYFDKGK